MFSRALDAFGVQREPTLRSLISRLQTARDDCNRARQEVDELLVQNFELVREIYRLRRCIDSLTAQQANDR